MSKVVKCKFCSWKTPLFRTIKSKDKTLPPDAAWDELRWHCRTMHADQFEKVRKKIKTGTSC